MSAVNHLQAALAHHQAGRLAEASQLYRHVLSQIPDHPDALRLLGAIAHQSQDLDQAEQLYQQAIAADPTIEDPYINLGKLYQQQHREADAIALYQSALARVQEPQTIGQRLASLLDQVGDWAAAAAQYQTAIAQKPNDAVLHHNLATVLHKLDRLDEAIASYDRAIDLNPSYAKAFLNLGSAERQRGNREQAIAQYQTAIAHNPEMTEAYDALGSIAMETGHLPEAIAHYRQSIEINPSYAEGHFNLAIALLLAGDLPTGFAEYEWRFQIDQNALDKQIQQPRWNGEVLNGQRILLYAEQGFGDAIQFVRYVPEVARRGGRGVVGCPDGLVRLFQTVRGVEVVSSTVEKETMQTQAALMSLPHIFGTSVDTVPAEVPYFDLTQIWDDRGAAIAQTIEQFAEPQQLRVGIAWAGSAGNRGDRTRSMAVTELQPLLDMPNLALYSLQKGDRAIELAQLQAGDRLLDLAPHLHDFADTAIAIAHLDVVITVDTSVAHLAGALGKPVWILLCHVPDWRWMLERADSPWYPTARLFRQPQPGDWETVIIEVLIALDAAQPTERSLPLVPPPPTSEPTAPDPLWPKLQRGFNAHQAEQLEQAEAIYDQVLQQQPNHGEALQLMGTLLCQQERYREGVEYLKRALEQKPDYAEGFYNLGSALHNMDESDEAIAAYERAIALRPIYPEAYFNMGNVLKKQQRHDEAAEQFRRAIAHRPHYPKAWRNLGSCLQAKAHYDAAIRCYQHALDQDPDYANAYSSWGYALTEQGNLTAAFEKYEQAIALDSDHVDAHFGQAALQLRMGNYIDGFQNYEWRWKYDYCPPRNFSQPVWAGDRLNDRAILLHDEQGLGDAIQAIRFAQFVRSLGGRVILECRQELSRLFSTVPNIDAIVTRGRPLPAFNCHAPLMSLPRILGCTLDTIPDRVPYLTVPDGTALTLPPASAGLLTVGIVWSANPINKTGRKRTCPLEQWEAIAHLDAVQLYSLQKEPSDPERDWLHQHGIVDLSDQLTDLAETAAAIQQLDLVITVDTVVAHLGGALGKPTWVLLMFMPDWRWLVDRTDSPWYPTARLFRQPAPGAWAAVLSEVQTALTHQPPRTAHQPIIRPPDAIAISLTLQTQLTAAYDAYQAGDFAAAAAQAAPLRHEHPDNANVLHLCAVVDSVTGHTEAAIANYYAVLRLHPPYAESHGNLAVLLKQQEQEEEAIHHYRRAIAINPTYLSAYCNLGNILQARQELDEAIALYRTALAIDPTYAKVWMNMANALAKQRYRAKAIAAYQNAIAHDPNYVEAYSNLGNLYAEHGDTEQGLAMHEKAVAINPNEAQAQHNYSIALLRDGNYALGFERYEYRWQLPEFWAKSGQSFEQPRWDGSPLNGRTLLVWSEQGFGDVMQFARFLPLIQGGTVLLDAHPALKRLLDTLEYPNYPNSQNHQDNQSDRLQVIPTGSGIPAFDVQIPIMSLPHVLGTTLDTLPADVPYLTVPEPRRVTLPPTAAPKIGLVWAAKATHPTVETRSIPLADLKPFLNLPDVAFYSLQKDCPERDRPILEQHPNLYDLSAQLNDFGDTAAAIAQLDLVISIDTSVAHLAGALNHPTWLLLPVASDWRWLRDRTDTPWYPNLRLFRQSEVNQWEPVLRQVYSELRSQFQLPESSTSFPVVTDSSAMSKRKSRSSSKSSRPALPVTVQPAVSPVPNESVPKLSELLADAVAKHRAGEADAAEALYHTIRQHYPQDGNSIHLLGVIAYQRNQYQEAVDLYEQALERLPNYAEIHNNMAVALDKLDRKDESFEHYQKALALKPDYAEAWHNLGTLEQSRLNIDTAIHHYQKSVALKPDYADGFNSWGSAYKRINQLPEALEKYNRALDINPNHIEARCGRAAVLMKMGDYRRGFMEYEWRWKHADCPPRVSQQPAWDGSNFHGKVLLLYAEQGLGDSIQMIRYIPKVLERGDRIWVECNQPGLTRLFKQIDGIEQVFERGEAPKTYHLHAPLMSLPRFFGTTVDTIPAEIPYLSVPDGIQIPLPPQTPGQPNVGIVWSANPLSKTGKNRSCDLNLFEPLLSHPSLNVYSIQKDVSPEDQSILDRHGVLCLGSQFSDLADTACIIQQLDLVITVDTVIAHLTGALGKPAWVMLNLSCDWRWLSDRTDTPWYPTLRLFRQKVLAEWEPVIADMVGAIADFSPHAQPSPKPASPVPPPVVRQPLGIGWPMSLMTGWGNFGVNLVLQLSQMADFGPVLLVKSEAIDKLNPLHRSLIEPLMGEFQRLQQIMAANPGKQLKLNVPILHALGNGLQCGLLQSLSGSRNVGVIFLEDTALPPDAIARGRQFDMIAAGSKWNEDILRAAGLTNTYSLPQGIDPTRFHPGPKSGLLGDRFVVFSGGKLEYRKGQDIVVAAFRRFVQTHPDAILITAWHNFWPQFMAGIEQTGNVKGLPNLDKQRRLQVKSWLVANGIPAQNTMDIGPIPNYLMGEVIREADVAVFPNRGEGGTNLAAMECLACGIPTIISANTGHLDIVGDRHCYPLRHQSPAKPRGPFVGVEGWGESEVNEVVAALEQVYQDRTEAKQKGAAAAEFMQDWTWAKQVRRICDGLRRVGIV